MFRVLAVASIAEEGSSTDTIGGNPRFLTCLELADADAAVARGDLQQHSAAVQFAADPRALNRAVYRNRQVKLDVPVAGVGVQLGSKVLRQTGLDTPIAGMDEPTGIHLGAGTDR